MACSGLALNLEMSLTPLIFEQDVTTPPKDHDGIDFHLSALEDTQFLAT